MKVFISLLNEIKHSQYVREVVSMYHCSILKNAKIMNLLDQKPRADSAVKFVDYRGLSFAVRPGDFFPGEHDNCGTHFFANAFVDDVRLPVGGSMIEVGCGSGFTGLAVTKMCNLSRLIAGDVSLEAVSCTRDNAQRLDVQDKVTVLQSDVFDSIPPATTADIVYWNTPWLNINERRAQKRSPDPCLYDPGYKLLARYVCESEKFITPHGRRFIGTGSGASLEKLGLICEVHGCKPVLMKGLVKRENKQVLSLYELVVC